MKKYKHLLLLALLGSSITAFAQTATDGSSIFYSKFGLALMMGLAAVVILFAVGTLYRLLAMMIKIQQIRIYQEKGMESYLEALNKPQPSVFAGLYQRWTKAVPLEDEEDILFDHEYDGIRELDNSLPPWWVAMFYITIFFAVVYFSYYHILDMGPSQTERYEMEMKEAEQATAQFLASQPDLVDETNVERLDDETALAIGQTIYNSNCIACHGQLGEGGVGPNLTDQYWIHGGGIQSIFKTIKYGVPEKGMIPWKTQLRAGDMQKVASYIMSMEGSNPPNGKAPEGELYEPSMENPAAEELPQDSTSTEALGLNTEE